MAGARYYIAGGEALLETESLGQRTGISLGTLMVLDDNDDDDDKCDHDDDIDYDDDNTLAFQAGTAKDVSLFF